MEGLLTVARADSSTTQENVPLLNTKYMPYCMCDHAHLYNISEVLKKGLVTKGRGGGVGVNVDHEEAVYR